MDEGSEKTAVRADVDDLLDEIYEKVAASKKTLFIECNATKAIEDSFTNNRSISKVDGIFNNGGGELRQQLLKIKM